MKNKVIYDGQCSFCIDVKNIMEFLDFSKNFEWIKSELYTKNPNRISCINNELTNKTIVLIKPNNQLLTEFKACRYIMSRIVFFYPIIVFMYIPFVSNFFGRAIYQSISKRRKCRT